MTCPHGFETRCHSCHEDAVAFDKKLVQSGSHVYVVVPWRGDGRYAVDQAADGRVYKIKSAAQKYANRLNSIVPKEGGEGGWVVRMVAA